MEEIVITIDVDGAPTVEGVGFKGRACEAATRPFEEALGRVTSRKAKPEATQVATVKVGGGSGC